MLLVTVSNIHRKFISVVDSVPELAIEQVLDRLQSTHQFLKNTHIVPLPGACEVGDENTVGMVIKHGQDPYEAADDEMTYYVKVEKYYIGSVVEV